LTKDLIFKNKNMPNWCNNSLKITGDTKQLKSFAKKAKGDGTDLSLDKLFPLPKKQEKNWYNWCVKNWGTKWDIEATLSVEDKYELGYGFDSAWSPPVEAFEKISKKYPKLVFWLDYDEPSMGFKGMTRIQNGEVEDNCFNY